MMVICIWNNSKMKSETICCCSCYCRTVGVVRTSYTGWFHCSYANHSVIVECNAIYMKCFVTWCPPKVNGLLCIEFLTLSLSLSLIASPLSKCPSQRWWWWWYQMLRGVNRQLYDCPQTIKLKLLNFVETISSNDEWFKPQEYLINDFPMTGLPTMNVKLYHPKGSFEMWFMVVVIRYLKELLPRGAV